MIRSAASKVMWVGRAAIFFVGLAVVLALLFGVAATALAGTGVGATFNLGKANTVNKISSLIGSTDNAMLRVDNNSNGSNATALTLQVEPGKTPMKINSSKKVANLNSDKLDGKHASKIGVNGAEQVSATSPLDSSSPKTKIATCPNGKIAVAGGARLQGSFTNIALNESHQHFSFSHQWQVSAHEVNPTANSWRLDAYAICVLAGGP